MANEAHIRIDEGIKRGTRPPRNLHKPYKPGIRQEDGQVTVIPADLNPDHVLDLYLTAKTTSSIAKDLGIRRHTLVRWLRTERPEQWKQAQAIRALLRKEDGEEGLEAARDALSLARAREQVRAGQWELQALDRDYAPKQEVTVEVIGDLMARVQRAQERVIEGVATTIPSALPAEVSKPESGDSA